MKRLGPDHAPIDVDTFLADCVNVEPAALDEEFIRLPADLAYWNEQYSRAHRAHLIAKLDAEREESRIMLETREEILSAWRASLPAAAAGKKQRADREPSGDVIRAAALQKVDYRAIKLAELEAEVERTRLRGVVSALEAKKDMLQSLGAKLRSEMTDPLVRNALRMSGH